MRLVSNEKIDPSADAGGDLRGCGTLVDCQLMNIQSQPVMTADEFLRWNEGREGKRELVHGRVYEMMTGGSRKHAEIMLNLAIVFRTVLNTDDYVVTAADYAVRTPVGIRYPDILVLTRDLEGKSLATEHPLLVAEILSPSSLAIDFGEKAEEYTAIESLRHYLVLSQDEPRVWLWSRNEDGAFQRPKMIEGAESDLPLTGFDLTLKLAELYRGIA
ncbi:Uma2 family endonuclease [Fulvimarina sp. MAC8]|uniref:Uma2 family endonuclease n=1 Tax=Fulvimarina sp. MAC8 TaxID=3162874 RepID=UPI0032ED5BAC